MALACSANPAQLLSAKLPSFHATLSCLRALKAAQVESATIATPGTAREAAGCLADDEGVPHARQRLDGGEIGTLRGPPQTGHFS